MMSCNVWPTDNRMLLAMLGDNWPQRICRPVYCCHNFHRVGLLKLDNCVNKFWELCTCLVPHHDNTDNNNNGVDSFWLLMS
jgi:hypothetical protein